METLNGYVRLTYELNKFFFSELRALRTELPDANEVAAKVALGEPSFTINVRKAYPIKYNNKLSKLRATTLECIARNRFSFGTLIAMFFAIRCLCAISAVVLDPMSTFWISLAQFIILPCSFIVSFQHFIVLGLPLLAPHYIAMVVLDTVVPQWFAIELTITPTFVLGFMLVDQLLCFMFMLETPKGKSIAFEPAILLKHIVYGFMNCKTYALILLLLLLDFKMNMTLWVIDACFGVSTKIAELLSKYLMDWATVYYHQHRIAHLPIVYEHAHKFHHYLHDTTPFDAHIYGAGAPEEWFCLLLEAAMALRFGYYPAMLNYTIVMQSIASKIGHTRSETSDGGINHHADHHTLHRKNFGFGSNVLVDMVFGTNSDCASYGMGPYQVTKIELEDSYDFKFVFQSQNEETTKMLEEYRNPNLARCFAVIINRYTGKD